MKKSIKLLSLSLLLSAAMTSCYTTKYSVGEGAQTGVEVKGKNHFFLFGLIPGKASDPQAMANGAKDFEVTQVQTFVDGLLRTITFGIYSPTATLVQK